MLINMVQEWQQELLLMLVNEDDVRRAIELVVQMYLVAAGQADELKEKQKLTLLLHSSWRLIDDASM